MILILPYRTSVVAEPERDRLLCLCCCHPCHVILRNKEKAQGTQTTRTTQYIHVLSMRVIDVVVQTKTTTAMMDALGVDSHPLIHTKA
mmetsp:Transcript_10817/g.10473  ORF Transcript_10817/g.10473 Transcript_10817/m.10473 type:complete len:88 (-) Transcript_10817:144-407(-)